MNIPERAHEAGWLAAKYDGTGENEVTRILEAAAPFIAAQALRNEAGNWTAGNIRELMLIAADELDPHE